MLWKVSVTGSSVTGDDVAEWLGTNFGQPAASYTDAETRRTTVSVYLQNKPDWSVARREELALNLEQIVRGGSDIGPRRLSLTRIPQEDWAESWKLHFKPLVIGSALLLRPTWSRRRPLKGQAVVTLDPGLSFGTGRHPTTAFCLRELVARRPRGGARSCLDVGTGSGILAIAAAKLGAATVAGIDVDTQAIAASRDNARLNKVTARFALPELSEASTYDVVVANILANPLQLLAPLLAAHVRIGGHIVLSGILEAQALAVMAAYAPWFTIDVWNSEEGWVALAGSRIHDNG